MVYGVQHRLSLVRVPAVQRVFNRAQRVRNQRHALRMFHDVFVARAAHQRPATDEFHPVQIGVKIESALFPVRFLRLHKFLRKSSYFRKFCKFLPKRSFFC